MNVLVDTSVWSLALRKNNKNNEQNNIIDKFKELIKDLKVKIIGPIRQEILSGIKNNDKYEELKEKLSYFPDESLFLSVQVLLIQIFALQ